MLPARALHQALALRIIRSRQRRSGPVDDMDADSHADSTENLSAEVVRAGDVGELLGVRPDAAVFTKRVLDDVDAGRSIGCRQRQRARSLTAQLAITPLLLLLMVAFVALVAVVVVVVVLMIVAVVIELGLEATAGVDNWPLLFLMLSVFL